MQLPTDHKHTLGPGEKPLVFPEIERMYACRENSLCDQEKFCNSLSADGSVFVVNCSELLVSDV